MDKSPKAPDSDYGRTTVSTPTPYDAELGKITEQDREYARDLLEDLTDEDDEPRANIVAKWLRKARYEAVIADRKARKNQDNPMTIKLPVRVGDCVSDSALATRCVVDADGKAVPPDTIAAALNGGEALRKALENIAKQKTTGEIKHEYGDTEGDFEGAYDMFIRDARAALSPPGNEIDGAAVQKRGEE